MDLDEVWIAGVGILEMWLWLVLLEISYMLDFFFPPGGELALVHVRLSVLAGCDADAWWRRMWLLAGLMHP